MPTTRKKVIKTVYKDEDDDELEEAFSDSGSDAQISEESSSDEGEEQHVSSDEEFVKTKKPLKPKAATKRHFAKSFVNKINKNTVQEIADANIAPFFSVKLMSEEDKLLPSVLNLSESDSSDDESKETTQKLNTPHTSSISHSQLSEESDNESNNYKDVWSGNLKQNSDEIARKTFLELAQHSSKVEEIKSAVHNYTHKLEKDNELDVKDLLAQGEEVMSPQPITPKRNVKAKKRKDDSDSDMEDWEEVKESKGIPQQGLQLIVDIPNTVCRKTKKVDVEMMMKRKLNRVKKEYQVYMHKVHVLCWLGHGNYVSKILNDQDLLAAALALVPSKDCYPGVRVDMNYIEQITTWFKDKLTLKQDKNENKYRPKAPPLKDILKNQIKSRVVTTKKYLVYIFICMLRALGLQCRVMFNFVTLPIKPPSSELCSLSTKVKNVENDPKENFKTEKEEKVKKCQKPDKTKNSSKTKRKGKIPQLDGINDYGYSLSDFVNINQLDGSDDTQKRSTRVKKSITTNTKKGNNEEDVSPPKRLKQSQAKATKTISSSQKKGKNEESKKESAPKKIANLSTTKSDSNKFKESLLCAKGDNLNGSPRKTRSTPKSRPELSINESNVASTNKPNMRKKAELPKITVTAAEDQESSKYFEFKNETRTSRKRSKTANPKETYSDAQNEKTTKKRTKSAPNTNLEKSKYFSDEVTSPHEIKKPRLSLRKPKSDPSEDQKRVSHRDLAKTKPSPNKIDIKSDLIQPVKGRKKTAKEESKEKLVKGKAKAKSNEDSDYLSEEDLKESIDSDDDFKPKTKLSPRPSTSKKIDRRVLSSDDDNPSLKTDVWCEVFVEELEQWIPVDVIKAKTHCAESLYKNATHPVCYIVGWDNNNYLKDLTRRYVPQWNTVTRKQRVEPSWWNKAIKLWLCPKSARDKEEDEQLDRMQLEAPLPKSIAEYKNHPLYALKRHLLKFEAIYPPDAVVLGFVRSEPVYSRDCVYTCRSRDTWLKEAKTVKLGESPYKVVKARPKWDKLSNSLITDKPLEVFGPWQVQDYEPPQAENGIVPRNAYGNVELFKECMLPKGTVHIKLPGLNKVAKKLNIDCAPAMTGFDFNGGWSHPVYDGFVVCKEFEEIVTEAWVNDQEEQERKENEKLEARVYGNWRRLIKGLFIRERLKNKYGFEKLPTSVDKKKLKGPRVVAKKK